MPRTSLPPVALAVLCIESAVLADVVNVPGDAPTIQAGIDVAMPGDEVVVADGVYTGVGNVNVDFRGKAITVRSANGAGVCVVDGGGTAGNRGFLFTQGETASSRLAGFTIRNCVADGAGGGGLQALGGDPTVVNCSFVSCTSAGDGGGALARGAVFDGCVFALNSAGSGGGLSLRTPGGTVRDSTFLLNVAELKGGAVFGRGEFTGCVFDRNRVVGTSYAWGGAISGVSLVTLDRCVLTSNTVSTTSGNAYGGAVALVDGPELVATRCVFSDNSAVTTDASGFAGGGAVYNFNDRTTLHGCMFVGNSVDAGFAAGSAVRHEGLDFDARNCTVSRNFGGTGSDAASFDIATFESPNVVANSILRGGPGECGLDAQSSGGDLDVRYCALDCFISGPGNIFGEPRVTTDGHLSPGSPCIDAGSNSAVPAGLEEDIDGETRFQDDPDTPDTGEGSPPIVDIGADEFAVNVCPEDLDGSGAVDFGDILAVLRAWGPCGACPEDLDGSGAVDFDDMLAILSAWGDCD